MPRAYSLVAPFQRSSTRSVTALSQGVNRAYKEIWPLPGRTDAEAAKRRGYTHGAMPPSARLPHPRLPAPVLLLSLSAIAIVVAACGSSSKPDVTSTLPASAIPTAQATSTPRDLGFVEQLAPALLQPADVSPDWHVAQNQNKALDKRDVPGLHSGAEGAFTILASPDKNEFINELVVVPDDRDAGGLLAAFTSDNYLGALAPGANDAKASFTTLPGTPPGTKVLTFSGTVNADSNPQSINGDAVAFVHGAVFVIVIHGTYQPPKYPIDPAALAKGVNTRLAGIPGAN